MERSMSVASSNQRKSLNEWLRRPPTKRSLIESDKVPPMKGGSSPEYAATQQPQFRDEWEEEFARATFRPDTFRAVCSLGSIFILFTVVAIFSVGDDGISGNSTWFYLTWTPFIVCALVYFSFAVIFSMETNRNFKDILIRNYELCCAVSIVMLYITCLGTYIILEIRMSDFGNSNRDVTLRAQINFTSFLPVRSCFDDNPRKTWDEKVVPISFTGMLSCNTMILSGSSYCIYALLNILPMVFYMKQRSAVIVTSVNTLLLIIAVLVMGTRNWVLLSTALFQLFAGLFASHFCGIHLHLAKKQFAIEKGTILANDQNSNLLYTLIPKNVVVRLAEHQGSSMLGTSIAHCTVMFCSLEPQEEFKAHFSERVFALLNEAFSAFDREVKRSGMFKYQHVSDWYIVACPRAAKPFDDDEQGHVYPDRYYLSMVLLADELKCIARRYMLRPDCPCWLKVGLHCGPVAGAVIGCYRAFYCLYGDTINTSARMCKYAARDRVHCSGDFAAALGRCRHASVSLESLGVQEIKGKGPMETFNVLFSEEAEAEAEDNHSLATRTESDITGAGHVTKARAMRVKSIFDRQPSRVLALPQQWQKKSTEEVGLHPDASCSCSLRRYLRLVAYCFSLSGGAGAGAGRVAGLDALSKAGRQWINDPAHRVDHRRMVFRDPAFERLFSRSHATSHRQGLIAALLLHLSAVACQWHLAVHPEFEFLPPGPGSAGGDGLSELRRAQETGRLLLGVHWVVAAVYSAGLFWVMWRQPLLTKWCGRHFVPVKLLHLGFSVAAFAFMRQEAGWTLVFCVDVAFLHCWMGTLSFRNTAILTVVALATFTAALPAARGFEVLVWVKAVAMGAGSVWVSRISNYDQRIHWRMHLLFEDELERLREKIFEFLPPTIAERIMAASATTSRRRGGAVALEQQLRQACDGYTAVVLQLDICKFTVLSQTMTPLEVAGMVHDIYSVFDAAVQERGLFKMDTIGDAYVVAGFLPSDDEEGAARDGEIYRVCLDVLHLARVMILEMARYRRRSGRPTHCRIGLATGQVIAGVLGRLQPRFHIFGEAVQTAEAMEQSGRVDAVHASHAFIAALSRAAPRSSPLASLVPRGSASSLCAHPPVFGADEAEPPPATPGLASLSFAGRGGISPCAGADDPAAAAARAAGATDDVGAGEGGAGDEVGEGGEAEAASLQSMAVGCGWPGGCSGGVSSGGGGSGRVSDGGEAAGKSVENGAALLNGHRAEAEAGLAESAVPRREAEEAAAGKAAGNGATGAPLNGHFADGLAVSGGAQRRATPKAGGRRYQGPATVFVSTGWHLAATDEGDDAAAAAAGGHGRGAGECEAGWTLLPRPMPGEDPEDFDPAAPPAPADSVRGEAGLAAEETAQAAVLDSEAVAAVGGRDGDGIRRVSWRRLSG